MKIYLGTFSRNNNPVSFQQPKFVKKKKKKIMNHYDDYIQLKNESEVQSDPSWNVCFPYIPYVSQLLALPKSGFQKPILISNQDCSIHYNIHMALSAIILYWVTNIQYLLRHWSFSFSFLFSAPLTFLSGAWKNMRSYCCWGETKFNFWVGIRRIIHEQISSKWYDLLNFGLWFIFMYSCYC